MKKLVVPFFLLCALSMSADARVITYTYDAAGNRTVREPSGEQAVQSEKPSQSISDTSKSEEQNKTNENNSNSAENEDFKQ